MTTIIDTVVDRFLDEVQGESGAKYTGSEAALMKLGAGAAMAWLLAELTAEVLERGGAAAAERMQSMANEVQTWAGTTAQQLRVIREDGEGRGG